MKRVTDWMKHHWLVSGLIVMAVVWQAFWVYFNVPIRNPWPRETYTVKGRFPFDKGYDLVFMQNVYGGSYWHQRLCGMLSFRQLATCGGGGDFFKPRRIDDQHYEVTLYRDYYFPGLPGWRLDATNEWPLAFQTGIGFDQEKALITSLWPTPVAVCDDSPQSLRELNGKLFCMQQYDDASRMEGHLKYKDLDLGLSAKAGPGEKVKDFWLYSELDALLQKEGTRGNH